MLNLQWADRMMIANLDNGTLLSAPSLSFGTVGNGTTGVSYFYAVCPYVSSQNGTHTFDGVASLGTTIQTGTLGTSNQLFWSPQSGANAYGIWKGTNGTMLNEYVIVSGTLGTWIDPAVSTLGTGVVPYTNNTAYSVNYLLPVPSTYNPVYNSNLIVNVMANYSKVIYNKGDVYVTDIAYTQIFKEEYDDLMGVYNWKANLRFLPKKDNGTFIFDVIWTGGFNFQPVSASWVNAGFMGKVHLEGISRVNTITGVF